MMSFFDLNGGNFRTKKKGFFNNNKRRRTVEREMAERERERRWSCTPPIIPWLFLWFPFSEKAL